jgi:hypothetical protein
VKDAIGVDMWKCPKCATHRHQFQSTCPCGYLRTPASEKFGWEWNPKDAQKSSTGSLRFNKGKAQIHQVPSSAITGMAEVLGYGETKYGKYNWAKGNDFSVPFDSAMRHMLKFWDGEDLDDESGFHHLKHALTNLAILLEYYEKHPNMDDRPSKVDK